VHFKRLQRREKKFQKSVIFFETGKKPSPSFSQMGEEFGPTEH